MGLTMCQQCRRQGSCCDLASCHGRQSWIKAFVRLRALILPMAVDVSYNRTFLFLRK